MYLEEEYNYYRLALDLATEKGFNIMHIDSAKKEIWMEQQIGKTSHVIRLAHRSFDWSNQLKNDMNVLVQKAKNLKRALTGRKILLHSVYIAKYPPVDNWEKLKKPEQMKGGKPLEINLYYMDEQNFTFEKDRLYSNLSFSVPDLPYPESEGEMEEETDRLKTKLQATYQHQREQAEALFSNGTPFFIYAILLINLYMFYLLETNGGSTSPATLIEFGAKYNPAILEGEWWRIISSMFLHVGVFHLLMNMLALFYLGTAVERIYGNIRFLPIYFLAGIFGGTTSFVFNNQVAAGASGALFGLFGSLLFFGLIHRKIFFQTMGWNLLFIIALNIFIGVMIPQIDNGAHIGGLIGGFLASGIVALPGNKKMGRSLIFTIVYILGIAGLWIAGTSYQTDTLNPQVQIQLVQQYVQEEEYQKAYEAADLGVEESSEFQAEFLFYRAYAAIHQERTDQAIEDLEQVVSMDTEFPEAHYNLALLYLEKDRNNEAAEQAELAYELNSDNEQFENLYNRLTGEE